MNNKTLSNSVKEKLVSDIKDVVQSVVTKDLPSLPEPDCKHGGGIGYFDSYSKNQMVDYAQFNKRSLMDNLLLEVDKVITSVIDTQLSQKVLHITNSALLDPFDLQRALDGCPVITRNGQEVNQITLFECNNPLPLLAVVDGNLQRFRRDGKYMEDGNCSELDLFMKRDIRNINGYEVPSPETEQLQYGDDYILADPTNPSFYVVVTWYNYKEDFHLLKNGLVFTNVQHAIATAKAMLGINPNED